MTIEEFKEVATEALSEVVGNSKKTYGWTDWYPEKDPVNGFFEANYGATLWEDDEDYLIGEMRVPSGLSRDKTYQDVKEWLEENLVKFE
jgi:hypothetical protein